MSSFLWVLDIIAAIINPKKTDVHFGIMWKNACAAGPETAT
jgi:hypothetical protein